MPVSRFWSLRTRFVRRQLRIPYRPHPGIGTNLLRGRRLAHFFAMDDEDEFPPGGDDDEPFSDS
jgi:hypothetical protein